MDSFWEFYIQGSGLPIFLGLFALFVILPIGLYWGKKRENSSLASLKVLASDLGGRFLNKSLDFGNITEAFKDNDWSEYTIQFDFNGRQCIILPYAYPSHAAGRSALTPMAAWATVFKLKIGRYSKQYFLAKYEASEAKKFFLFPFQKDVSFKEENINIENREFFDKVVSYNDLVSLIKNIQFVAVPVFEMKIDGDLLYIKVDKVENQMEGVKKYLDFMDGIANKIETIATQ